MRLAGLACLLTAGIVWGESAIAKARFEHFKAEHGRSYSSVEEEQRHFEYFKNNMKLADFATTQNPQGQYGFTAFSDSAPEAVAARNGWRQTADDTARLESKRILPRNLHARQALEPVDWTEKGAVGPVWDQGWCGSCYAFSALSNLEGQHFLKTGILNDLSVQEIVDCDHRDKRCEGGFPPWVYEYVHNQSDLGLGIDTDAAYPYNGHEHYACSKTNITGSNITDWVAISTNETEIAQELATRGPLSAGINSNRMTIYRGGIDCPVPGEAPECDPEGINHGVLLVGWGVENGTEYWKIKNTFGVKWGEEGYYRICKGQGACGINLAVTSAIV